MSDSQVLPLREKVAYGLGDFASSMFWKLFSLFLLFFYTDVFGISAAAAGTMFLVTRIWDSANDPLMGIIADRTSTRWGKFRPYLLFVALPFAIVGVLTFTTPDLSEAGKLIYAYVTYTLMMMVYTAINVPYASLMGVMSNDTNERTSLASWRFIGGFSGGLFVTATANPAATPSSNSAWAPPPSPPRPLPDSPSSPCCYWPVPASPSPAQRSTKVAAPRWIAACASLT